MQFLNYHMQKLLIIINIESKIKIFNNLPSFLFMTNKLVTWNIKVLAIKHVSNYKLGECNFK